MTTPLPWTHLSPASITVQRELSTTIGSRAISGSVATRFRKVVIASSDSRRSASMFTSRRFAPPRTWSSATSSAALEVACLDQSPEERRAGDVRSLADHREVRVREDRERLEPAEARDADCRFGTRLGVRPRAVVRDGPDVVGGRAAAAADDVHQPRVSELAQEAARVLGLLVVAAEGVRQAGVRVAGDVRRRDPGKLGDVRPHLLRAQRAVDADDERLGVLDGGPEGLDRSGPRASSRSGRRS